MIRVYALYGRNRRVLAALLMVGAASILFTSVRFLLPAGMSIRSHTYHRILIVDFFLLVGNGRKPPRHVRDYRSHFQPSGVQPILAKRRVSADPTHVSFRLERRSLPCFVSALEVCSSFGPIHGLLVT
jgi:hypothetical protein